jgi:hypothetical protein
MIPAANWHAGPRSGKLGPVPASEKVLDRVRKLLKLAESSNVHEAANAAARAQALMERHRIDAAALDDAEPESIGDYPDEPLESSRRIPRWKLGLAATVARLGGCRVYLSGHGDRRAVILVGRADDAAAVRLLYAHLCRELDRLTRKLGHGRGRKWCTAFRLGAVATVVERLEQAQAEAHRAARAEARQQVEAGDRGALARIEHGLARLKELDAALDAWMRDNLDLRRRRPRTVRADADAYAQGRAAGHSVALGSHRPALPPAL